MGPSPADFLAAPVSIALSRNPARYHRDVQPTRVDRTGRPARWIWMSDEVIRAIASRSVVVEPVQVFAGYR
jgi:hypothetical protein